MPVAGGGGPRSSAARTGPSPDTSPLRFQGLGLEGSPVLLRATLPKRAAARVILSTTCTIIELHPQRARTRAQHSLWE